ncbi:MAG: hypothetical protein KME60_09295 [Cyanomargarita calcarea GSE-NOS-MK-12-04C]|uniref:Uncharacterized protein n=1 Tax=Cyanomargarita calcarea GSE-NOS-MK-12-04C TaxID=2839659 RepID=A0A951QME0_9CYAN|nr:hypothetical protein [Cyanomargarita calcarea GSE-NOS-MK-12-04C]
MVLISNPPQTRLSPDGVLDHQVCVVFHLWVEEGRRKKCIYGDWSPASKSGY